MLSGLVRTGPYRTRTVPVPYRYGDENPVPVFGRAGTGTVRYGPHFFDEIENIARRRHTTFLHGHLCTPGTPHPTSTTPQQP